MSDAVRESTGPASTIAGVRTSALAGASLFLAGSVAFMGIVTAEVLYPDYTTRQEISDLGSTVPPDPIIHQPSATIFNGTMLLSGALIVLGAVLAHRSFGRRDLSVPLGVFGAAVLGVGVFPGNVVPWHGLFALLTFFSGGVTAVLSARVVRRPFRYLCVVFGLVSLASLLIALFLGDSGLVAALGSGGIERWVAYPLLLWVVGLGDYLLGADQPVG